MEYFISCDGWSIDRFKSESKVDWHGPSLSRSFTFTAVTAIFLSPPKTRLGWPNSGPTFLRLIIVVTVSRLVSQAEKRLSRSGVSAIQFVSNHENVDPTKIVLWVTKSGGATCDQFCCSSPGKTGLVAVIAEATQLIVQPSRKRQNSRSMGPHLAHALVWVAACHATNILPSILCGAFRLSRCSWSTAQRTTW